MHKKITDIKAVSIVCDFMDESYFGGKKKDCKQFPTGRTMKPMSSWILTKCPIALIRHILIHQNLSLQKQNCSELLTYKLNF